MTSLEKIARQMLQENKKIDEVSEKKLDTYRHKATDDSKKAHNEGDKKRETKRDKGRHLAFDKATGRGNVKVKATKEETLHEVSKALVGRYITKASSDLYDRGRGRAHMGHDGATRDEKVKHAKKTGKREKGISMAVKKLTKEDIDPLIQTALDEKPAEFLTSFSELMQNMITDRIEQKKIELAQSLFGAPEEQEVPEPEDEEEEEHESETLETPETVDPTVEEGKSRDSDENRKKFNKFRDRDQKRGAKKSDHEDKE